jgi:hypothetical protein
MIAIEQHEILTEWQIAINRPMHAGHSELLFHFLVTLLLKAF